MNNLNREFSLAELGSLVGVDQNTLKGWIKAELLAPIRLGQPHGRGKAHIFDLRSVLAAGLLKTLKRGGATLQYAKPIAEFVGSLTPAEIDQAAADDLLLVYAGAAIPPQLQPRGKQIIYQGAFPELGFQASVRELWKKTAEGIAFYDSTLAAPLN